MFTVSLSTASAEFWMPLILAA